jgi:hypothetical protein
VTLGLVPYRATLEAYGIRSPNSLREAVAQLTPVQLSEHSVAIPVYHPGAWSRRRNRSLEDQVSDWRRVKSALLIAGVSFTARTSMGNPRSL